MAENISYKNFFLITTIEISLYKDYTIFIIAPSQNHCFSDCIALCLQKDDIFILFLVSRLPLSLLFFTAIVALILDIYASL